MNSRERVLNAIRGEETSRPACDFWAETATVNKILLETGYADINRFLDELDVDIRGVEAIAPQEKRLPDGVFQNYWGERYKYHKTEWGDIRDDITGALAEASSVGDILSFPWPHNDDMDYSTLQEQCRRAKGRAIRYGFADVWQRPAQVRGLANAFMDMVLEPVNMHCLSRIFTDFYMEDFIRAWDKSNEAIDIFTVYSDLGSQSGPLISQVMFEEFVVPYLKELVDLVHSFGAAVLFHSCGMILPFISRLIEIGVDIVDPIQPTGMEMSPENLASQFGGRICFHGGIDMQRLLPLGSAQEVAGEVKRYVKQLSPGYIVGPAHYFQPDVPVRNITALYRTLAY